MSADQDGAGRRTKRSTLEVIAEDVAALQDKLAQRKKDLHQVQANLKARDMEKNRQRYQRLGALTGSLGLDVADLKLMLAHFGEGEHRETILSMLGIEIPAPPVETHIPLPRLDTREMSASEKQSLKTRYGLRWKREGAVWEIPLDHQLIEEARAQWGAIKEGEK